MWILPKNYPLSLRFALDMVESKEDLTLPGLNIESSLMWRSKPSALPTWLRRWKADSYLPHLFLRILKPFQRRSFETAVTSSLAVTRANPFQRQECEKERTTQDTSGLSYGDTLQQLDLIECSLKTSRVTSRLDCPQLLPTWKKIVTDQRGEYSQRVKSALLTRESESLSWLTPMVQDSKHSGTNSGPNGKRQLLVNQVNWPTPSAHEARLGYQDRSDPTKKGTQESLTTVIVNKAGGRSVCAGHLNPDWVEWLMGVPTGWTALGSWGTESCQQQPQKRGEY